MVLAKLPFFPTPYPDETLYSIISRYHQRSGNTTARMTSYDTFEKDNIYSVFSSDIQTLCKKLSDQTLLTSEFLIHNHTMDPLYSPFNFTPGRGDRHVDGGGGLVAASIETRLRRPPVWPHPHHGPAGYQTQSTKGRTVYLKHCRECFFTDLDTYGESFWHRSHQLYDVDICYQHGEWLVQSEIPVRTNSGRFTYILPTESMFNTQQVFVDIAKEGPLRTAKSIHWLLNRLYEPTTTLEVVQQHYHSLLHSLGYSTHLECVYLKRLQEDVVSFCRRQGLNPYMIEEIGHVKQTWFHNLLEISKLVHPINHVLFMDFLGMSSEEFMLQKVQPYTPFGPGPWPCLNPVAPHFRADVVTDLQIDYVRSGFAVGTFTCSCGFKFTKVWPYPHDAYHYTPVKILSVGDSWEKELLRLRNEEHKTFAEIAQRLQVIPCDIEQYYNWLNFKPLELRRPSYLRGCINY